MIQMYHNCIIAQKALNVNEIGQFGTFREVLYHMKKRTETVKDRISLAFIHLLKEKEYHDITIVDIINEAQAGRMSFYRNFADKDDILRHYIAAVTDEWLSHTEENYITLTKDSLSPYIIWLLSHMYQHKDVVSILIRTEKMYLLEEEFDKRLFSRLSETASTWEIIYKIGGIYKLFVYWAKNGFCETPQEIAEYVK